MARWYLIPQCLGRLSPNTMSYRSLAEGEGVMKIVWAKSKLCGNFQLPIKTTVRPHRNMNEFSVSLCLESKFWNGYFYMPADEAVMLAKKLREAATAAKNDMRRAGGNGA